MSLGFGRAAAILLALVAPALGANAATTQAPVAVLPSSFVALQRLDARVQTVGWKLARANAEFCPPTAPGIGLQLHDVYGYAEPGAVKRALGLASDIAVQAIAADGPAARAGLRPNDPVVTVAGQAIADLPQPRAGDYARLAGLHDRIDAALAETGQVEIAVLRDGGVQRITIPAEPVCASRFEMLTGGNRAAADGSRIVVSRRIVEFLREEDQLAALLAHELAHNALRHRLRLRAEGRTWPNIRVTEREADRLSVWLLANAGYDPAAALRFMTGWGRAADPGIFAIPDHDGWRARTRLIAAEVAKVAAARATRRASEPLWPHDLLAAGAPVAGPR